MPVSEAQMKAKKKWEAKSYDTLNIRVKKGDREKIKAYAESQGMSINSFCKAAIFTAMDETSESKE